MAAALGMILGAVGSTLGQHARQNRQDEHESKEHFMQMVDDHMKAHPEDAAKPEFAKIGKQIYKDHWEPMQQILGFAAQAKQKEDTQFQQLTGDGGQPNSTGQGQPAPGAQTPKGQPGASPKQPETPEEWEAYRHKLIQARGHFTDPAHLKAIDDEISFAKDQTDRAEHHQEFEQTNARIVQNEQTMTALREQGMESSNEFKEASLAIRQSEAAASNSFKEAMLSMKESSDKNAQQAHLQTAVSTLQSRAKALAALPIDQAKPLLSGFNANVKLLKKQLKDADLGDVAEGIKPLTTENVSTWGGLSSKEQLTTDSSADASSRSSSLDDARKKLGL